MKKTANGLFFILMAAAVFSQSAASIILGVLLGIYLLLIIRRQAGFRLDATVVLFFLLVLWSLFTSLFNHSEPELLGRYFYFTPLLLAPLIEKTRPDIRKIFFAASGLAALMVGLAFLQMELGFRLPGPFQAYRGSRFFSFSGYPIGVAGVYCFLAVICISQVLFSREGKIYKLILSIFAALLAFGLILTETRSFYIALAAAMLIIIMRYRQRRAAIAFSGATGLVILFIFFHKESFGRVWDFMNTDSESYLDRLAMWKVALKVTTESARNLFTGVGYGGWRQVSEASFIKYLPSMMGAAQYRHVHNVYLQCLVETGLIGLFLYLGLTFYIIKKLRAKLAALKPGGFDAAFTFSALLCVLCYMLGGLFDYLHDPFIMLPFYTILAFALSKNGGVDLPERNGKTQAGL